MSPNSFTHPLKALLFFLAISLVCPTWSLAQEDQLILDLDLSELMQIKVTSAARKEQKVSDTPAAVYVVTQEAIKESGATSIPEVLRMVPGLQVARISSSVWAISARGFNGLFANKLLVQIDGRTVYVPSFAGVYWDTQNMPMDDIERIEVIRGPGAALWGANAVNGIINIITKDASQTQGGMLSAGTGNIEKEILTFRYGGQLNKDTYGRFYLKRHAQNSFHYANSTNGTDSRDEWEANSFGFRLDGDVGTSDSWLLKGDVYQNEVNHQVDIFWQPQGLSVVQDSVTPKGLNLLGRWTHKNSPKNSWSLQAYYDHFQRDDVYLKQRFKVFDADFQQNLKFLERHDFVWGGGYRSITSDFTSSYTVSVYPESGHDTLLSCFAQDEIALVKERLWLTLGSKLEKNDYTDYEVQPSARLLWKLQSKQRIWGAVSRAVRTPSQIEDNGRVVVTMIPQPNPAPPPATVLVPYSINGNQSLNVEKIIAYEVGYRFLPSDRFDFDITVFFNDYKDIVTGQAVGYNLQFVNGIEGESYGLEAVANWQPYEWLQAELSYSFIELDLRSSFSNDVNQRVYENSSPRHQASIRTNFMLEKNLNLHLWGRYVDTVKDPSAQADSLNLAIDDYFDLDCTLIWQADENLEVVLAGQNLLDDRHPEYVAESFVAPIEVERSFYAKLNWKF